MHPGQGGRQLDLDEGGRGGVHPPGPHRARPRRRGGRDGIRRAGPGRHARAQDVDLPAGVRHPRRPGGVPTRGHHLRPQHLRHRHRHRGARRVRPGVHRSDAVDPRAPRLERTCRAVCRTSRSRSGATRRSARRCTRCSSSTPSAPGWTWASSTPARWPCTTTSIRSCGRRARTSCSTADPTVPSASSRSPSATATRRANSAFPIWRGASSPSSSASRTRWCTASPTSSPTTSKRHDSPRHGRSTSSKAR